MVSGQQMRMLPCTGAWLKSFFDSLRSLAWSKCKVCFPDRNLERCRTVPGLEIGCLS